MFFVLSKVLGFFAIPSNLVIALGLARRAAACDALCRAPAGDSSWRASSVLAMLGYSPIGNALIIPLEQRFPPWDAARGAPDGIVVLGGAISPDVSTARNDVALNEAAERMTVVVELGAALSAGPYPVQRRQSGADLRRGAGGRIRAAPAAKRSAFRAIAFSSRTSRATPSRTR